MQILVGEGGIQNAQLIGESTGGLPSRRSGDPLAELRHLSSQPPSSYLEQRLAELFKQSPQTVLGARHLFPKGYRLECPSTQGHGPRYYILVAPHRSRILSITNTPLPIPNSTDDIRCKIRISDLKATPYYGDFSWLSCLSQLIQIELDRSLLKPIEHQNAFRLLRELASEDILPSSLFVDVKEESKHPVNYGGSADIYRGRLAGNVVCVKGLRHRTGDDGLKAYTQSIREGVVWRQLKHQNILQCLGVSKSFRGHRLSLVSLWMENGNIMDYLKRNRYHDRLLSLRQIAAGIEYLHGHQPPIVHRDIKGANVIVNDQGVCCLADFGLVSLLESQRSSDHGHGTIFWQAPERLDPTLFSEESGCPADIYSFAWTIVEICHGCHPFQGRGLSVIREVLGGTRTLLPPDNCAPIDEGIWDIVKECWCHDPNQRLEIGQVVQRLSVLFSVPSKLIPNMKLSVAPSRPPPSLSRLHQTGPMGILTPPSTPTTLRAPTPVGLDVYPSDSNPFSPGSVPIQEPFPRPRTPIRKMLSKAGPVVLPSPPVTPFRESFSAGTDAYSQGSSIQAGPIHHQFSPTGWTAGRYPSENRSHAPLVENKKTRRRMITPINTSPFSDGPFEEPSTPVGGVPPSNGRPTGPVPNRWRPQPRPFHTPFVEDPEDL